MVMPVAPKKTPCLENFVFLDFLSKINKIFVVVVPETFNSLERYFPTTYAISLRDFLFTAVLSNFLFQDVSFRVAFFEKFGTKE